MEIHKVIVPKEHAIHVKDKTPSGYPKKFFVLSMIGSSRSGKTTCQVNLIDKLASSYTAVLIFTPSVEDPIWTSLKRKQNVYISQTVSNQILHQLFEKQKSLYRQDKQSNHILIVIDDYGLLARQSGSMDPKVKPDAEQVSSGIKQMLDVLYSRGRHFGISLLCSYHEVFQLSPLQRVNNTHVILYRLNTRQLDKIAPELRCHLSERDFVDMAEKVTMEPFCFLYIDLKAPRNEDVFKVGRPAPLPEA